MSEFSSANEWIPFCSRRLHALLVELRETDEINETQETRKKLCKAVVLAQLCLCNPWCGNYFVDLIVVEIVVICLTGPAVTGDPLGWSPVTGDALWSGVLKSAAGISESTHSNSRSSQCLLYENK